MVGVSGSVNLPLHHKVQKFFSGTGSPGWSQKKDCKTVVVVVVVNIQIGLTFQVPAYAVCPGKEAMKQVSVFINRSLKSVEKICFLQTSGNPALLYCVVSSPV